MNAFKNLYFYDVKLGVSRKHDEFSILKATFSHDNTFIIAIAAYNDKGIKNKLIFLNFQDEEKEIHHQIEIKPESFSNFENFWATSIYNPSANILFIGGVLKVVGTKEIHPNYDHFFYILKGNFLKSDFIVYRSFVFNCQGYDKMYIDNPPSLPAFKYIYLKDR